MQGIAYWIDKRASITPDRTALAGEARRVTYREMAEEITRIALTLRNSYGVAPGDRVAILSGNSIEYIEILFAIAKLGAMAVPLNIRLTEQELAYQVTDSGTSVVIASRDFWQTARILQETCKFHHLVQVDQLPADAANMDSPAADGSLHPIASNINGETPYIICYTSGTTGRPKGAVLTQENMYWNAINNILAIDITSNDRILTLLPLFHIGGIGLFAFPALLAGGTVIVPDRFDPNQALSLIETEKITIVMGVPTIHDAIRKSDRFASTDFSSIRWFYSGGAPCPHELIRFYLEHGIPFGQGYGMTETSPTVFMLSREDFRRKIGSIGKPAMFCDIRIVDDGGTDVPTGEVGELLVKGPNVLKEYWNLPEATAGSFSDGWLHTGDLVKMDQEGFVYIAGRKKDLIISGGENIYPLEVEQVFAQHPSVEEAAVIGKRDEKWGEVPVAIVVPKEGVQLTERELIDYCIRRLAKYKCPKQVICVSALPKNATGKIDKASLKKQYGIPS
ncbi:o-succinylbenzoate--CoA ligase [Effusibacillus lacus]|uniref:2-succinylbenzoate--CoA ligase n=1 Tax=Effusibacillus lacus TaxID=1348429 RepID=A0A292YCR9_9BACL|nr:o-succinylbenzoate--CoA ligase [Effusibacillus lacus]TCS73667.1 fatty-acyl-CoA synthase [Effusibacillus lacus]GAX89442.1 o-succinylbenzoate--CoA ligase [Effusibacillus lacus]